MEKDPEISNGNYTTHFRALDTRIGRWWSNDPVIHEYLSPYNAMDNNPIVGTDVAGNNTESTHTDDDGNVIAVYDDGDDGIYRHSDICSEDTDKLCTLESKSDLGTSRGGIRMGVSLTPYSFTDFGELEKGNVVAAKGAKIDFSSKWAMNTSRKVMRDASNIGKYFLNAGTGGKYDIKVKAAKEFGSVYYGSILIESDGTKEHTYSSARDAGNFVAGYVKQKSYAPNHVTTVGFGAYNYSGNNKTVGALLSLEYFFLGIGAPSAHNPQDASPLKAPFYGEDKGTGLAIEKGTEFGKTFDINK